MSPVSVVEIGISIALVGAVGAYWVVALRDTARHERAALREHSHAINAHFAAVEASEDDPIFSPESVERFVKHVVALADEFWSTGALAGLSGHPESELVRTWARSWQDYLGTDLESLGEPSIDLLRLVNRAGEDEDRVIIRVQLRIHCEHPIRGTLGRHRAFVDDRWTLGHSNDRLVLLAMSGDPLAAPVMAAPLIPNPIADTERLREESLAELAFAQTAGSDVVLSELVNADESPELALLDLSVVDGRFLPALIAAGIAHLVEAWEGASTGAEAPFASIAEADAREALLRPDHAVRLVVRDAVLISWKPTKLRLEQNPPAIDATLEVEAVRYLIGDDGHAVAGNMQDPRPMELHWTLVLADSVKTPWRLATSNCPAEAIPGWP